MEEAMSKPQPIEYAEASREVRAVFDDIKKSRNVADVNNFWKYLARDPALLKEPQGGDGGGRARSAHQGDGLRGGERDERLRLLHRQPHRGCAQGRHDGGDVR